MYRLIILCCLVTLATTAVIPDDSKAEIIRYENTNDGTGNYRFSYETSNGITREETGQLVNVGTENEHIEVVGSFSYTDSDGHVVVVNYTADENGYQIAPEETPVSLPASVVASLLG